MKEGGAAERVAIRAGDVILSLDGQVMSPALSQLVCAHHCGELGLVFAPDLTIVYRTPCRST